MHQIALFSLGSRNNSTHRPLSNMETYIHIHIRNL